MTTTETRRPRTSPNHATSRRPRPAHDRAPTRPARKVEHLERRFAERMNAWDRHVATCQGCLRNGQNLCDEGRIERDEVLESRQAMELAANPPAPSFDPFGPLLEGAAAFWILLAGAMHLPRDGSVGQ